MLQVGDTAPNFTLPDQDSIYHTLAKYKGKWVFLYFYPKDNTPGCTVEACSVRDNLEALQKKGVIVFGISTDSAVSHKKFEDKYQLNFALLADEEKNVVNDYGVWGEKSFLGKTYMGTKRMSFLIDPQGKIAKIYEKVNPKTHIQDVLKDLENL